MAQNKELVLREKAGNLKSYLNEPHIKEAFQWALPKWLSVDRLLRVVFSSTMKNPTLLECSRASLLQSVMACAQLGLEPILGRAYLIPYKNKGVYECQFQPGYQGLVDLARRSGQVVDVFAEVVKENDEFDFDFGTNKFLRHKPILNGPRGKVIAAYTVWELVGGQKTFLLMPIEDIEKVREASQAFRYARDNKGNKFAQSTPWIQWPEEMMKKTVIKRHSKTQPASIEFMRAIEMDDMAQLQRSQATLLDDSTIELDKLPAGSEVEGGGEVEGGDKKPAATETKQAPSDSESNSESESEATVTEGSPDEVTAQLDKISKDDPDNFKEALKALNLQGIPIGQSTKVELLDTYYDIKG